MIWLKISLDKPKNQLVIIVWAIMGRYQEIAYSFKRLSHPGTLSQIGNMDVRTDPGGDVALLTPAHRREQKGKNPACSGCFLNDALTTL